MKHTPDDSKFLRVEEAREAAAKPAEPAYTREQVLASRRYGDRRDALSVALKEGRLYTDAQIEAALKNYYSRKVN